MKSQPLLTVTVASDAGAPPVCTCEIIHARLPQDYVALTVLMMVLCALSCNFFAFVCLFPALWFAQTVSFNTLHFVAFPSCM